MAATDSQSFSERSAHDVNNSLTQMRDLEEDAQDSPASTRQRAGGKERARVLIANSLLQLPIWGFAMSYGVTQEFYTEDTALFHGGSSATGAIGTTFNGVIYMSMPFLFAAFARRWASYRQRVAFLGVVLASISYLLSSLGTDVWQVIITQGVLAALGSALTYSPTTLSLGEWYTTSNRAVAYGIVLSSKNVVGSVCPFMIRGLLDAYGFRTAMKVWAAIVAASGLFAVALMPGQPVYVPTNDHRSRQIPWHFLKHRTFYIYAVATVMQSAGYGMPQTYLNSFAHEVSLLSQTSATLLLTLFNAPGILSSSFFGYLSQNKRFHLSATTNTCVSALSSAMSALLLWGLAPAHSMVLLSFFSVTFGFFAGGYSATWGGVMNEIEQEAQERNEAIDTGVLYGLLNGARGVGYVSGGLISVELLKSGGSARPGNMGYQSEYLPIIVFTGLASALGGWGILWKVRRLLFW